MRTTQRDHAISVLDRFLTVLDTIRDAGGRCSVAHIASRTDIPKSSISRLVQALVANGYLVRVDGGVGIGFRLFELGARTRVPRDLGDAASPILAELSRVTGEHVNLAVRVGGDMVSIAAVPGRLRPLPSRPGGRVPCATTALGKAVLAFADDAEDRTRAMSLTVTSRRKYLAELADVRARTVAVDRCATFPGVVGVASPVLDAGGVPVAAVSVAGPVGDMDAARMAPLVRAAARGVARRLGVTAA